MLDTPPLFMPNPQLAQEPVAKLLNHFTTALSSWLSDPYGLVQTGVLKDGKTRVPQLYAQDGSLNSLDLYPDERMKSLSFFEREGPSELKWDDAMHRSGEWLHPLAAVVWVNMPLIDANRGYDFSDELALDFLTRGLLASEDGQTGRITPGAIEQRAEQVFRRYTDWPVKQQLLMYPYAGFRIPFVVRQRYVACAQPFTPAGALPIGSTAPAPVAGSPLVSQTYPFTSQQTLTIAHNLGRRVVVEIYDHNGDSIEGDVCYDSMNQITIVFSQPLTGTVVLI